MSIKGHYYVRGEPRTMTEGERDRADRREENHTSIVCMQPIVDSNLNRVQYRHEMLLSHDEMHFLSVEFLLHV